MRAWLAHHREGIFLVLAVLAMGAAILAWGEYQDRQDARDVVAACERGNEIRAYLAFDNDERILRIEQQLNDPGQITTADAQAFRDELLRRLDQRERLVPFPCESLQ